MTALTCLPCLHLPEEPPHLGAYMVPAPDDPAVAPHDQPYAPMLVEVELGVVVVRGNPAFSHASTAARTGNSPKTDQQATTRTYYS